MERHNGLNHSMSADHRGQSVNTSIKGPWKRRAYISAFALAVFTPSPACIMANNSAILNPTTPLAYLPPAFADQLQVSCYVAVAGLSAFVWDWLMSMPDECKVFCRGKFGIPVVAYFMSRVGTLGFCVSATIFQVGSVRHCQALLYITGGFYALALPSTSLLFFYRVRAVYGNSRVITCFFGFAWMTTLGLSVLVPLSIDGDHIGPTNRCINTVVRSFASVPILHNAINDTLIFIAISYHISSCTTIGDSWSARAKSLFVAGGLPRLSRGLMQGGQLYYFATIGFSLVFATMVLLPDIPVVYHSMLCVPNLALENAMACRVHRAIKLGYLRDRQSTHFGITVQSNINPEESDIELAFKRRTPDQPRIIQFNVDVTSTKDTKPDDGSTSVMKASLVDQGSNAHGQVQTYSERR